MSGISIISSAETTASAIDAGKMAFNAEAENIANQYTREYKANKVDFGNILKQQNVIKPSSDPSSTTVSTESITFSSVKANMSKDSASGTKVYDPGNPNADTNGFIEGSNVQIARATANSTKYSHYINANWAVAQNAYEMAQSAIRGL